MVFNCRHIPYFIVNFLVENCILSLSLLSRVCVFSTGLSRVIPALSLPGCMYWEADPLGCITGTPWLFNAGCGYRHQWEVSWQEDVVVVLSLLVHIL